MINADCKLVPILAADFVKNNEPVCAIKGYPVYDTACVRGDQRSRRKAEARAQRQLDKFYEDYNDRKRHENQRCKERYQIHHLKYR